MDARRQRQEIAGILASGYWRLLTANRPKARHSSQLEPQNSPQSRCYVPAPE